MIVPTCKRIPGCCLLFLCFLASTCSKPELKLSIEPNFEEKPSITVLSGYVSADSYVSNGYPGKMSYLDNDTVELFISATTRVNKARLGLYDVAGTLVDYIYCDSIKPQTVSTAKPYEQGYGYGYKIRYKASTKIKSGVYQVSKKIPLVVRNSTPANQVLVVYPSNTENAYNDKGGASMYTSPKAPIVSFLRPTPLHRFCNEFVKWNGTAYAFDYITDLELDNYENLANYKLLVVIGHNEYWTRSARVNFDRFISEGKSALMLTGNTMWWQVRYSADKSQLICYKSATLDPIPDPLLKTITWNSSTLKYPVIPTLGADFSKGGYAMLTDSGWNGYKILVPSSPLLQGTNLVKNSIVSCATHEFDGTYLIRYPNQDPILDLTKLNAYRAELIGYDIGQRNNIATLQTFIVYQRTATSGIIINAGSTNWCHTNGFGGPTGATIKLITKNAIELLMAKQPVFSSTVPARL